MKKNKKTGILVTGAAGAVGLEVVNELIKNHSHFHVRAFDLKGKHTEEALKTFKNDVEIITGSVNEYSTLEKAVSDMDIIIHLAAIIPPLADINPALAWKVNVEGTRNLVKAVRNVAPDVFFLHTSSVSVYGDRVKQPWISVGDKLHPSDGDEYGKGKVAAEKIVRESGLRFSIFRLTGIMGTSQVKKNSIDPLFFHMPLDTSYEMATTRDTGFAISRIPYHLEALENRIFNLAGGKSCRVIYQDFLNRTLPAVGLDFKDFPKEAFATHNFHCGFFTDSHVLENILHFQRDSVESYIQWISGFIPFWKRLITKVTDKHIIRYMLKHSDPLKALLKKDIPMMKHFFRNPVPLVSPTRNGV